MNALMVALLLGGTAAPADTLVEMSRGDRVVLENLAGEVVIEAWNRDALEVRGLDDDEAGLRVRRSGSVLRLQRDDSKGRRRDVEIRVRVPAWTNLAVNGRDLEVTATGIGGTLTVSNLEGDIWIENAAGDVVVNSISGEIRISHVTGSVTASAQSDDVTLRDVRGDVTVYSGDGDVQLSDIVARRVEAETQDGDIDFNGVILEGGEYGFFTHDGDVTVAIPANTSARVSTSTFDGDFQSEFPVVVERYTSGREFDFKLGDGSARIRLHAFDGEIRLLRR